ncbi:TetR/AcrR family transcriptional regulator [Halorientalis marina]|uniref:TetR/AcrR family transcriptional regulator n=1 Tax=Halorientalis marina TaxID=2931976 RepID=UPI001FF6B146|nr:TetR/AcrR family transcriptional regulator [Halorientalis marina]
MSDDTSETIMRATYRALCDHGYADLTMQDIADETDKSKAALHYHYDSKRDLLHAFLDHLYEEFTARVAEPAGETPAERLEGLIDDVLRPTDSDADDRIAFRTALLELKAQAPYDEGIRERLQRFDASLRERVRTLVAEGIDDGTFRAVDPDDTAQFIVTALDGAGTKQVAVGQDIDCARRMLHAYVETHLVAGGRGADATRTPPTEVSE